MILDGINPSNILLFTFTKKAATEIKERIVKMIGDQAALITVSTYHSFCAKLIRQYHNAVGLQKNFTILDDNDKIKIIKKIIKDNQFDNLDADNCLTQISKFKELYRSPEQVLSNIDTLKDNHETRVAIIYDTYQRILRENNSVDFDDLICYAITILETRKDIQNTIWKRYKYITADEAQDSSTTDIRLIFNLIPPENYNLSFVMDSDQSIYAFRGAQVRLLYERLKQYPGYKSFYLERNYRSTKNIVNASQALIDRNHRLDDKTIYTNNKDGNKVCILSPRSSVNEAESVAAMIAHLHDSGQLEKYGEVAILYRNLFLSKEVEDALMKYKIPYKVISGTSFYERLEIKDMIAYLNFLVNPQNLLAFQRIIDIPKVGIGEVTFAKIKKELLARFASYGIIDLEGMVKIIGEMARIKTFKKLAKFHQNLEIIAQHIDDPLDQLIDVIVQTINYKDYLKTLKGIKADKEEIEDDLTERTQNLNLLKDLAYEAYDIREFLDSVTLNTEVQNQDLEDDECVKLMTIHASKGLEFSTVFVVGCNSGIIPSKRCTTIDDIEEERRLMYVAMTRAKELLVLSSPRMRFQYGQLISQSPSQFLSEIDEQYLQYA